MIFTTNTLLNFFLNLISIWVLKLLPIIILLIILYILHRIHNIKNTEYAYKIYDFDFNGFCIASYLLCYICLILWVRIKCFSQTTDLKLYINLFKEKYLTSNFYDTLINIIILIIIFVCVIYFFRILQKFFIKQIIKRFLILQINYNINLSPYTIFVWERKLNNFMSKMIDILYHSYSEPVVNFIWKISYRIVNFIIIILPHLFLYVFFIYELLFNNFIITPNFYKYLFFYFIYRAYKRSSAFIADTDIGLNYILFCMYYKEKSIMYVNIPQEYQKVILRYIELGLHRNMKKNPEPLLDNVLGEFCYYISQNCEFHLTNNGEYANNEFSFYEITNKYDTIFYPHHYLIKVCTFINKILFGSQKQ